MPRRPLLWWAGWTVVLFAFLAGSVLGLVWAEGGHSHAPVGAVLLACAGAAGLTAAVPLALARFFPRAAVATGADLLRLRARPPARLIGPSIGWPAFLVDLGILAVLGWWSWTGWMVSSRADPGVVFAVWLVVVLRAARPWGHRRDRVPTRFPFRSRTDFEQRN